MDTGVPKHLRLFMTEAVRSLAEELCEGRKNSSGPSERIEAIDTGVIDERIRRRAQNAVKRYLARMGEGSNEMPLCEDSKASIASIIDWNESIEIAVDLDSPPVTTPWQGCRSCSSSGMKPSRHKHKSMAPCRNCQGRGILATNEDEKTDPRKVKRVKTDATGAMDVEPFERKVENNNDEAMRAQLFVPRRSPLVVIIGGGIGGCALALALQQRNIKCIVFEKDSCFDQRSQGYGLTMQQAATTLRKLGFMNLKEYGIASESHASLLPDGTVLNEYGRTIHSTTRNLKGNGKGDDQRFNIQLPRQALRKLLYSALAEGTVRWGFTFSHYKTLEETKTTASNVRVFLTNSSGEKFHVDSGMLVGSDGIWSKVRVQKMGLSSPDARYLGVIVILGRAACSHPLADKKVFQTLGGATRMYCMPFEDGVTMWQLSFPMRLDMANELSKAGPEALLAEGRVRCKGWHDPIPQILESTKPCDVTGYPAYDRPAPSVETTGACQGMVKCGDASSHTSVVLIGDAAHPMSPFKGQGANQALIDAWSLARFLCSSSNDSNPIADFEHEMVDRVRSKVEKSAQAAVVLHTTKSVEVRCSRKVT